MNTRVVVRELRARGVTLTVTAGGLHWEGPPAVLGPGGVAALERGEPRLVRRLRQEAEAAALAEKVGRLMLYWQEEAEWWPEPLYESRRDLLLAWMDQLDAALARTGDPLEAYGWSVSARGIWGRV